MRSERPATISPFRAWAAAGPGQRGGGGEGGARADQDLASGDFRRVLGGGTSVLHGRLLARAACGREGSEVGRCPQLHRSARAVSRPRRPVTIWRRDRARAGSHHRRRRGRREHRVPPHREGVARRRGRRARRADQRVDLPLGGAGGAAPLLGRAHAADDVERRVLPAARRRDRARPGLEGDRQPPARVHARARPRAPPPGRAGRRPSGSRWRRSGRPRRSGSSR